MMNWATNTRALMYTLSASSRLASSLIRVEGIPVPHPKTQQICLLLAYKVEFPEETRIYDLEKIKALQQKFSGMTIKERFDWILSQFEVYSGLVGRRNLAGASLLTFFTPIWLKFNGVGENRDNRRYNDQQIRGA